jgi:uncharacterized repeat protein (TIGR03803 family)
MDMRRAYRHKKGMCNPRLISESWCVFLSKSRWLCKSINFDAIATRTVFVRLISNFLAICITAILLLCIQMTIMTLHAQPIVNEIILYNFPTETNDGTLPVGLIQGIDGALYGTTSTGGPPVTGNGTVFKINLDGGGYQLLHTFPTLDQGGNPVSKLLQATDGFLYGITAYGSNNNKGAIFKINTNGTGFQSLFNFPSNSTFIGETVRDFSFIQGKDGSLYGTSPDGGSQGCGNVFKINTDGSSYSELHSFSYRFTLDGNFPYAGVIQGNDGFLYGTTSQGSGLLFQDYLSLNQGIVFRINTNGSQYQILHSFAGGSGGQAPQSRLLQGADDALYGTTVVGGEQVGANPSGEGVVFKMNPDGTGFAVLHSFANPGDGLIPSSGLLLANDGALYGTTSSYDSNNVVNYSTGTVFSMNPDGSNYRVLSYFANSGGNPIILAQGRDGRLYGTTTGGGSMNQGTVFQLGVPMQPILQNLQYDQGALSFSWNSVAGFEYEVQYNTNLTATNWLILSGPTLATNGTACASDAVTNSQRFYRVVLLP